MKTLHRANRILGLILVLTMLIGCGNSSGAASSSAAYHMAEPASPAEGAMDYEIAAEEAFFTEDTVVEEAYDSSTSTDMTAEEVIPGDRKLIKTVYIDAETSNLYRFDLHLSQKMASLGGYLENVHKTTGSVRNQNPYDYMEDGRILTEEEIEERSRWSNADYVIRIPVGNLDGFVDDIDNSANITSQNSNVNDVTLNYVDMQSRKEAIKTEQTRLLELMENAESIEDIITIEGRLTEVRYELESTESKLRVLDNQIDYSTIHLSVRQVNRYTRVETPKSVGERIAEGFMDSLEDVIHGIREFGIWLVIHLPYLFVFFIVLFLAIRFLVFLIRRSKDTPEKMEKRRRKREEKERKREERRLRKQQAKTVKEETENHEPKN